MADTMGMTLPEPIIHNLLYSGNILLLHGVEESFKSVLIVQIAEALATATPLFRTLPISHPLKVGLIETEIDGPFIGSRFRRMFPLGPIPNLILPSDNALKDFRKRKLIQRKVQWVKELVDQEQLDVLMIDVVNDFFRGDDNASKEQDVGELFDAIRSLGLKAVIMVRHDKKFQISAAGYSPPSSNEQIRGSAQWKENPETILWIHRLDKRMNQVELEVGKMRYGKKPPTWQLWFDAGTFRLTPLPPVLAMLEAGALTRERLLEAGGERFDLGHSKLDKMVKQLEDSKLIYERQKGHQKEYAIDWALAKESGLPLQLPLPVVELA